MEAYIIDGRKFVLKSDGNLHSLPTPERAVINKLADDKGVKCSIRQFGRLIRTYNNTGINLPISQLVKEIYDGKRNDFYEKAEELNKLCNN